MQMKVRVISFFASVVAFEPTFRSQISAILLYLILSLSVELQLKIFIS